MQMTFYLCKDIDARRLRYYLHKLEKLDSLDPEILSKVICCKKKCKRTIKLTKEEYKIYEKFGKAVNLYLNYIIMVEANED